MKNFLRFLAFCLVTSALITLGCYVAKSQVPSSPTYIGAFNDNVFIPAVFQGKSYKITGSRFNTGSADTILDKAAVVTQVAGLGFTQVQVANNGYGYIKYTNNTAGNYGAGIVVQITYSDSSKHFPVPVISFTETSTAFARLAMLNSTRTGFQVKIKDSIAAASSVGFTYIVKGF